MAHFPAPEHAEMDVGPIRPPSEARSLLLRLTRGCPWNRCAFCHTYRGLDYRPRPAAEVLEDIRRARDWADAFRRLSEEEGHGGAVTPALLGSLARRPGITPTAWNVAAWLAGGGRTVFLQDADALALPTKGLIEILRRLRSSFPSVDRVTSYCRSRTAARKGPGSFRALREAGLDRVHIGLESGSDAVLELANKGVTARDHETGGRAVAEAGLELSEYVIPGLGGAELTREHAVETARVLRAIGPDFVRLRTLAVTGAMPLARRIEEGSMTLLGDDATVREIRTLVEELGDLRTELASDHILNLLEDVEGTLPRDRERILASIDAYLALDERDRMRFRIGRRAGFLRRPADLAAPGLQSRADDVLARLGVAHEADLDRLVPQILQGFI